MRTLLACALSLFAAGRLDAAAEPPQFDMATLDRQTVRIELMGIDAETGIAGRVGRENVSFAIDDILRIAPLVDAAAASPSPATGRVLHLADGGILRGGLVNGNEHPPRSLRVALTEDIAADVPFTRLAAIRLATVEDASMQQAFNQRVASRQPGRDFMVVAKDGKPLIVPGSLEQLGPSGWG